MQAVGGLSLTAGDVEQEILHRTLVKNPQHLECVLNNAFDLAKYVNVYDRDKVMTDVIEWSLW